MLSVANCLQACILVEHMWKSNVDDVHCMILIHRSVGTVRGRMGVASMFLGKLLGFVFRRCSDCLEDMSRFGIRPWANQIINEPG